MATLSKSRIVNQIKTYSTEQAVSYLVNLFLRASNENLIRVGYWLERLAKTETKKETIRTIRKAFENNHPVVQLARRLLNQLHPNCKRGIAAFIVQSIFAEAERRKDYFIPHLRQYSREVARIYKPIWEKEYQWARQRKKVAEKDPFYCQCNLRETL